MDESTFHGLMVKEPANPITQLLGEIRSGDARAVDRLLPMVYDDLRALARSYLRVGGGSQTLQPTALVNEAYLRLTGGGAGTWQDRAHFFGVAAQAMRWILADHSRRKRAEKRGGGMKRVMILEMVTPSSSSEIDAVELDDLLRQLAELNPRHARIVELRFFAGLTMDEIAEVLNCAASTVDKDWSVAR